MAGRTRTGVASVNERRRASAPANGVVRRSVASVRDGMHVSGMQRRRLLLAAGEVVGEGGFEAATVGAVCRRAGVSRRTFYELFEDREACALAAFEDALERIGELVLPVYRRESPWRERVRGALALLLERFDADPGLARMCVIESLRAGPLVLERRMRLLTVLALAVDEGRADAGHTGPPPLTAQGAVGGVLAVIHARLLEESRVSLTDLTGPLTAMILHPYLGPASAEEEIARPTAKRRLSAAAPVPKDPFKDLPIRFTYRTARVLAVIASDPGASNRHVADHAGIADEGQTSRLLRRLHEFGLIENHSAGRPKGEPNAWTLTQRGHDIHATLAG